MRSKTKKAPLILIIIMISMLLISCASQPSSDTINDESSSDAIERLDPIPFDLVSTNSDQISLSSLAGEKVYLKFWASWCSICLSGMEELNTLSGSDQDFKVITVVSPGSNGEKDEADFIEWFKSLEYENITVLLDNEGNLIKEYGIVGYPTSAYLDEEGYITKIVPGHVSNEDIIAAFDEK